MHKPEEEESQQDQVNRKELNTTEGCNKAPKQLFRHTNPTCGNNLMATTLIAKYGHSGTCHPLYQINPAQQYDQCMDQQHKSWMIKYASTHQS